MDLVLFVSSAVLASRVSVNFWEDDKTYKLKKRNSSCSVTDRYYYGNYNHKWDDDDDDDDDEENSHVNHKDDGMKDSNNQSKESRQVLIPSFSVSFRRLPEITFRWTLFTSLCLFSLCICETLPLSQKSKDGSTFLFFLKTEGYCRTDSDGGYRHYVCISTLYTLLMCTDLMLICFVAPLLATYYMLHLMLFCSFPLRDSNITNFRKLRFLISLFTKSLLLLQKYVLGTLYQISCILLRPLIACWSKKTHRYKPNISKNGGTTLLPHVHSKRYVGCSTRVMSDKDPSPFIRKLIFWDIFWNQKINRNLIQSSIFIMALSYWLIQKVKPVTDYSNQLLRFWFLAPVCTVGVFISSVLDGFSTISLVYGYLAGFFLESMDYNAAVNLTEKEINQVLIQLEDKKKDYLVKYSHNYINPKTTIIDTPAKHSYGENKKLCTMWSKLWNNNSNHHMMRQRKEAEQEIFLLETLARDLIYDLADIRDIQRMTSDSQIRVFGSLRFYLGILLSIILSFRLLLACKNILFSPVKQIDYTHYEGNDKTSLERTDPITSVLVWLVGHQVVEQKQYDSISQLVSLILTTFVSGSQIRNFFRVLRTSCRRIYNKSSHFLPWMNSNKYSSHFLHDSNQYFHTSKNDVDDKQSSAIFTCVFSSSMGCYFLSCIVSTKNNLPLKYKSSFMSAFGENVSAISMNATLRYKTFVASSFVAIFFFLLSLALKKKSSVRAKGFHLNHHQKMFAV